MSDIMSLYVLNEISVQDFIDLVSEGRTDFFYYKINDEILVKVYSKYFEKLNFKYCAFNDIDFSDCNFENCSFFDCEFTGIEFYDNDFFSVEFNHCEFVETRFFMSKLYNVNFIGGVFKGIDFSNSTLKETKVKGVFSNLSSPLFENIKIDNSSYIGIPLHCPEEGSFTAWKGVRDGEKFYLVKLKVLASAKRSSAGSNKCRCSKAAVLGIYSIFDEESVDSVVTDRQFEYKVGKIIYPDSFDDCRWHECSNGIHFFLTRQEVEDYFPGARGAGLSYIDI